MFSFCNTSDCHGGSSEQSVTTFCFVFGLCQLLRIALVWASSPQKASFTISNVLYHICHDCHFNMSTISALTEAYVFFRQKRKNLTLVSFSSYNCWWCKSIWCHSGKNVSSPSLFQQLQLPTKTAVSLLSQYILEVFFFIWEHRNLSPHSKTKACKLFLAVAHVFIRIECLPCGISDDQARLCVYLDAIRAGWSKRRM